MSNTNIPSGRDPSSGQKEQATHLSLGEDQNTLMNVCYLLRAAEEKLSALGPMFSTTPHLEIRYMLLKSRDLLSQSLSTSLPGPEIEFSTPASEAAASSLLREARRCMSQELNLTKNTQPLQGEECMRTYRILIEDDETMETQEAMEIEVLNQDDIERLTHPMQAREFAENIQSAIKDLWVDE